MYKFKKFINKRENGIKINYDYLSFFWVRVEVCVFILNVKKLYYCVINMEK